MNRLIFLLLVIIVGCKGTEQLSQPSKVENSIIDVNCYTQKEIPGTPDELIKRYLNCKVLADSIHWDSVHFDANTYAIDMKSKEIKIELMEGIETTSTSSAVVFYKTKDQNLTITLDQVLQKEDLYLP